MSNNKKEISIDRVKQITQEELQKFVKGSFSEESLRKMIQEQLENSRRNIVFQELGLRYDKWDYKWNLDSSGAITNMVKNNLHIRNIGKEVIEAILKQVSTEDILASLNKNNIQSLKKVYRETLMSHFEKEVRNLAIKHGTEQAEKLFKKYLYERVDEQVQADNDENITFEGTE